MDDKLREAQEDNDAEAYEKLARLYKFLKDWEKERDVHVDM